MIIHLQSGFHQLQTVFFRMTFVIKKLRRSVNPVRASVCRKTYKIFGNECLALLALLVLYRAKLLASNQSVLALGVAPMRVVSRRCRCVVQRLCATDIKRPCLVRAAAPHSAPAWMPGVYAQGLCRTQSPQRVLIWIENLLYFYKNRLFYKMNRRPYSRRLTLSIYK